VIANNVFVGPSPPGPRVADWSAPIDHGSLDHDGWFPDGTDRPWCAEAPGAVDAVNQFVPVRDAPPPTSCPPVP